MHGWTQSEKLYGCDWYKFYICALLETLEIYTRLRSLLVAGIIFFSWRLILDFSVEPELLGANTYPTNNVFNALQRALLNTT
jgi:hypothetical protein